MTTLYLVNQQTKKRYQIVHLDKETGIVTLRGEHAEFKEKYDRDRFKALGYTLVKEVDDA
jgi:hypothetical protein